MEPSTRQEFSKMSERLRLVEESQRTILGAFPAGDMEGHKRYHELMIEDINDRKRLIVLLKEKTVVGLLWIFLVFLGGLIMHGLHDTVYSWLHAGVSDKPPS